MNFSEINWHDRYIPMIQDYLEGSPLLLVSPPGSGVSLFARRLHSLVQPNADNFRAPHYSISEVGMKGVIKERTFDLHKGELHLADGGTLFLDQVEEFRTSVLAGVRDTLQRKGVLHENGIVSTLEERIRLVMHFTITESVTNTELDRLCKVLNTFEARMYRFPKMTYTEICDTPRKTNEEVLKLAKR